MKRAASSKGILPYQHITQLIARGAIKSDAPSKTGRSSRPVWTCGWAKNLPVDQQLPARVIGHQQPSPMCSTFISPISSHV